MRKITKQICLVISVVIIVIFATSCVPKTYTTFRNIIWSQKWISQNPDIWFEVTYDAQPNWDSNQNWAIKNAGALFGEINFNNEITPVIVTIKFNNSLMFANNEKNNGVINTNTDILLEGTTKHTDTQIIMAVTTDNIFDNKYKTIIFKKADTTSSR